MKAIGTEETTPMKTEYSGIEISYVEGTNDWHFELRGRSRRAESLAKAREAIDKEPKEKRTQTFPKFDAYQWSYGGIKTVTVTSLADNNAYSGGVDFWTTGPEGRRKEHDYSLFPVNDHNTALVKKIQAKEAEKDAIDKAITELRKTLQKATVPAELSKAT